MGLYNSREVTLSYVEGKIKDITWEIQLFLIRDGYKPFSKMEKWERNLKSMHSDLIDLVHHLRSVGYDTQKGTIDDGLISDIIKDCKSVVKETPELNNYKLEEDFLEFCALLGY